MADYARQRQRLANSGFTEVQVQRIRELARNGSSVKELAQAYLCGLETIRRLLRRETFAWVSDDLAVAAAVPLTQKETAEADAILARIQASLAPAGQSRLQAEAAKAFVADGMIDELRVPPNPLDE